MELFNSIIEKGIKLHTSDIHLGVGHHPVYRIDGHISFEKNIPSLTIEQMEAMAKHLLRENQYQNVLNDHEVDTSFSYSNKARCRVNVYKERRGINIALRILENTVPSLDSLGLPEVLKKIVSKPQGLVLVTGPTGSGKSTTLAALIDYINQSSKQHIITIEDPIEYLHENKQCLIKQREVGEGEDTRSFAQALKAALREDPDVILVGEMRNQETIGLALTAAETGHLVLSTLHTNSTYQTINRIIDVFPPEHQNQIRGQLAQSLEAIIAQRLIPKRGGGRIAALEILINKHAVATQIRENKLQAIADTIRAGKKEGMILLSDYMQNLVELGVVSHSAIERFGQSASV